MKKSFFLGIAGILLLGSMHFLKAQNIFEAVRAGSLDRLKTLLEHDPQLARERDENQRTALHWAAGTNRIDIVQYLLEKGADVNALDVDRATPLLLAISNGHRSLVKNLLDAGTDIRLKNLFGMSALHYAIRFNYSEEAKIMIDRGADLDAAIYNGQTPIHLACASGRTEILKRLLERGAKTDPADRGGNRPLHTAIYYGDLEAVKILLDFKADIRSKNLFGQTPLHQAAASGYGEIVRELLNRKAPADGRDNQNKTPIDLALSHHHRKIFDSLRPLVQETNPISPARGFESDLRKELKPGEAIIWYLGNCGWAVKTKNRLLVFDYWNYGSRPDEPSLSDGHIVLDEIRGLDLYFFVTHGHYDHYDRGIFDFDGASEKVGYIFGWKAEDRQKHAFFCENHSTRIIDGMEISNISHDSESAFLVNVDGLTIYHGGDYAKDYQSGHDYLSRKQSRVDILFSDYIYHEDVCLSSIEKLKPRVVFPMHCYACEYLLSLQADMLSGKFPDTRFIAVRNRGDMFVYRRNGKQ